MKKFLLFVVWMTIHVGLMAESGGLKGKVLDSETGEELVGVNIVITGTVQGATTDIDGNYSMTGLVPGSYSFTFSYVSFQAIHFDGIIIPPGETVTLNVKLEPVFSQLNEVVIEAKAYHRTESAMLVMQQKSATLLDGISTEQISRMGDSDAAAALKRVIGVTVQGDKYVYIRGLGDRYTKTHLNGVELPGLDPERNTVQMDIFPSTFIENMVVYKTYSPDLPGDFAGGLINIKTRDFPESFTFNYSGTFGFNTQSTFQSEFLTYSGGSADWLGFDNGNRELPAAAEGYVPVIGEDNQRLDQITRSFNKEMDLTTTASFINQSHSFSMGDQVSFLGRPLGLIAGLSYKNEWSYYDDGERNQYLLVGANSEQLNVQQQLNDTKGTMTGMLNGFLHGSLKVSDHDKIGIQFLYNHIGDKTGRYRTGTKPSDDVSLHIEERNLEFLERSVMALQTHGSHFVSQWNRLKADWSLSYIRLDHNEPDLRFFTSDYRINNGDTIHGINPSFYPVPARYYREMQEYNLVSELHLSMPLRMGEFIPTLKFGGAYNYKDRNSDERKYDYRDLNQSFDGSVADYLADENIGMAAPGVYGLFMENSINTDEINSYTGHQEVIAAYLMLDMPIHPRFRAVTGVRMESTYLFVENKIDRSHSKYDQGELRRTDFLPSVNLTYAVTDHMNIRLGYNKTIARPVFREIAPYAAYDFRAGYRVQGNPDIEQSAVHNADLRWEWFPASGEILSVSGFYKKFSGAIERIDNISAVNTEITYINTDATLTGLEFEFRKKLDFIGILQHFNLGFNMSLISSQVKLTDEELQQIRETDPGHPDTRAMSGQAPYTLNAMLGYDNPEIGMNSFLSYNIAGPRLFLIVKGGTPDVFEQPLNQLDFSFSQKINDKFSLKLFVKNILNSKVHFSYSYRDVDYTYYSYSSGVSFNVGVSYAIR